MTAKQYLRSMFYTQLSIEKKEQKIRELQELAESTGAIRYDKDRVVNSVAKGAAYEDKAIRVVDMQNRLLDDIVELADMFETGCRIINSLDDPIDRLILEMRYINHMKFTDIAFEMQYSVEAIYYRHRKALNTLKNYKV